MISTKYNTPHPSIPITFRDAENDWRNLFVYLKFIFLSFKLASIKFSTLPWWWWWWRSSSSSVEWQQQPREFSIIIADYKSCSAQSKGCCCWVGIKSFRMKRQEFPLSPFRFPFPVPTKSSPMSDTSQHVWLDNYLRLYASSVYIFPSSSIEQPTAASIYKPKSTQINLSAARHFPFDII